MRGDFSLSARIKSEKDRSLINSSLIEITVAAFQGKGSKKTGKFLYFSNTRGDESTNKRNARKRKKNQ